MICHNNIDAKSHGSQEVGSSNLVRDTRKDLTWRPHLCWISRFVQNRISGFGRRQLRVFMVDLRRLELPTSSLRTMRSPRWATDPSEIYNISTITNFSIRTKRKAVNFNTLTADFFLTSLLFLEKLLICESFNENKYTIKGDKYTDDNPECSIEFRNCEV